jgi:hypothetical protein
MEKNLNNEDWNQMIGKIISDEKQVSKEYEGFEIISDALDNKLTKAQLIEALGIMWALVMDLDKESRDERYLFGGGLLKFNEVFKENQTKDDFKMSNDQKEKLKTKITNLKPLVDFLIKMKDVIK